MDPTRPRRPAARADFEIAVICALPIEADAVDALFDHYWDDGGPPYDKAAGDPNAYSTGAIGRHNVVLAHMPGMGKASAAAVAANCRASFPNIKLALVVGVCGVVPFRLGGSETAETVLGDVIVSDGVVQYDLGRRLPEQFVAKDALLDALGRPNTEIRALLAKLRGLRGGRHCRIRWPAIWSCSGASRNWQLCTPVLRRTDCLRRHIAMGATGCRARSAVATASWCRVPAWSRVMHSLRFTLA
ncbi:hypothetical protein VTI74DRAFT_9391 [Chaetomium olivicolor]